MSGSHVQLDAEGSGGEQILIITNGTGAVLTDGSLLATHTDIAHYSKLFEI
jgi:hypothetical protein